MAQLRDPAYVKIIGQQVAGVSDIQEEACRLIACEVEYALRSVIQESIKYSKHFNRSSLKVRDISYALKDMNIYDKLYGHEENEGLQYKKLSDFWYLKRHESDLEQSIKREMLSLKIPPKISISMHWISVNAINQRQHYEETKEDIKKAKEDQVLAEKRHENLKHILVKENMDGVLSRELGRFFFTIIDTIRKEEELISSNRVYYESPEFKRVRECLQKNPGLNNIVPFLLNFIYDQHTVPVYNGYIKKRIYVKLLMAMANNTSINLEYHAHIIIKILLSFVTSSDLSNNLINKTLIEELKFRDYSAKSLVMFIYRYSDKYQSLQQEVASLLIDLLVRPKEESGNLNSFFGILRCFCYFNATLIKDLLLPQLPAFIKNVGLFKDFSSSIVKQEKRVSSMPVQDQIIQIKEIASERYSETYQLQFHMTNHLQNALVDIFSKLLANLRFYSAYSTNEANNVYKFFMNCYGEASILHIMKSLQLNSVHNISTDYDKFVETASVNYFI